MTSFIRFAAVLFDIRLFVEQRRLRNDALVLNLISVAYFFLLFNLQFLFPPLCSIEMMIPRIEEQSDVLKSVRRDPT